MTELYNWNYGCTLGWILPHVKQLLFKQITGFMMKAQMNKS